jgi:hypothetical protein
MDEGLLMSVNTANRSQSRQLLVRQVDVPAAARTRSTLPRIDYEDAFLVETGPVGGRTGEQWARAMLEDAPASMKRQLRWGWFAIGLKLGGPAPDQSVLGWELRSSTPEFALLGAPSRLGLTGQLLFEPGRDGLIFATFVQLANPIARAAWAAIESRHRRVVPHLLTQARLRQT